MDRRIKRYLRWMITDYPNRFKPDSDMWNRSYFIRSVPGITMDEKSQYTEIDSCPTIGEVLPYTSASDVNNVFDTGDINTSFGGVFCFTV